MLYLEDYLEMIEHLPQELRDRFTEMRELDLAVHNNMDSLDKKSRLFFQHCKRGELQHELINKEFNNLRGEYFKVMEDSDEKVAIATQIHELVERYLRRLDSELFKFKCELEADNNGITEILEKRSLELDGSNCPAPVTSLLQSINQKENRFYNTISVNSLICGSINSDDGIISGDGINSGNQLVCNSLLNSISGNNSSVFGSYHTYRKLEKRRETICTIPVQEKRANLNHSLATESTNNTIINVVMGTHINNIATHVPLPVAASCINNSTAVGSNVINQMPMNLTTHVVLGTNNNNNATAAATVAISNNNVSNVGPMPGTVTSVTGNHENTMVSYNLQQLGGGASASSAIAAAASHAIAVTQQMPQGRRTASLKASYDAIHGSTVNSSTEFWSAAAHACSMQPMPGTLATSSVHHQQQQQRHLIHQQHCQEKKLKKKLNAGISMSGGIVVQSASGSTSENSIISSTLSVSADPMDKLTNSSIHHAKISRGSLPQVNQLADNHLKAAVLTSAVVDPVTLHRVKSVTAATIGVPSTSVGSADSFAISENGLVVEQNNEGEWSYDPNEPRYCTCNQVSYGDMVACDNDACPYEWFHYQCVGITQPPKGKWFCPKCTASMRRRGNRKN